MAITYALSMTNLLNSLLSSFIETEKELVSVERIVDYIENIPEEETSSEVESMDRMLVCRTVLLGFNSNCLVLPDGKRANRLHQR